MLAPMSPPAEKPTIRINIARFWTGATCDEVIRLVLPDLTPYFRFEASDSPQIVLYGPYTGEMPAGRFTKVFIGCENVRPIMRECDWAFGVDHEDRIGHPRYMRLSRWGEERQLIQPHKDWAEILRSKQQFCIFLYTHPAPYREAFFDALSRYKHIDAPGPSKNNMASFDAVPGKRDWGATIEHLRRYKFVVSFENASRPGYNTEKLTHAIEADCVPIYWGDPQIERCFNARRFINAHDYLPRPASLLHRLPYRPHSLSFNGRPSFFERAARRINGIIDRSEQRMWAARGFDRLVERVIAVDRDDDLYLRHLREPFLIGNRAPDRSRWIARWREILEQSRA